MGLPNITNAIQKNANDIQANTNEINTIKSTYLPLSGGKMTGNIYFQNSSNIVSLKDETWNTLDLWTKAPGASLHLRSGDSPSSAGTFVISAKDNNGNVCYFHGEPNGKLLWDNNRVVCEKYYSNNETGHAYYSNGMAYVWGKNFFPAGVDRLQITFPYPMIDTFYNVYGSSYTSVCDVIAMGANLTTTGFLFCCRRSYDLKYDFDINASYFVIGRWK